MRSSALLHRQGAHPGSLASFGHLVFAERPRPSLDVFVQFFLMLQPTGDRGESVGGSPGWRFHDLHQARPFLVRLANDDAPVVVPAGIRAVGIVRRHHRATVVVEQRRPGPMRPVARRVAPPARAATVHCEVQQRWPDKRHAGHHLRQVDVLTFPRDVAMIQAGQGANRAVHAAGIVHV